MCRSRRNTLASQPTSRNPTTSSAAAAAAAAAAAVDVHHGHRHPGRRRHSTTNSASIPTTTSSSSTTAAAPSSSSSNLYSSTSSSGISTLRLSLSISENPTLYPFTDISAATNNFLSKRLPTSSSSSWRCTLRGKDVVIFQRPFPFPFPFRRQDDDDDDADPVVVNLPSRLSTLCKSHHSSLINLLGASVSGGGDYIYLVYPYVVGASLQECLRNPRNPNFTPLSKWISRMQIATDLADGLDYIHNHCKTIHNRIKTSSIIVTEPNFNAKICHFGAADLAGEIPNPAVITVTEEEDKAVLKKKKKKKLEEEEEEEEEGIDEEEEEESKSKDNDDISLSSERLRRPKSNSRSNRTRFQGTRGYIAPEVIAGGRISQKSDVFAFGIVILELLSGKEPFKYRMKRGENKEYERISLIDTARDAIGGTEEEMELAEEEEEEEEERRRVRIRQWVDRRLRDSFPVEVAEKLVRLALQCVEEEPCMRPEMTKVAGKVSKLFLDSKVWEDSLRVPGADDFSVTYGPR